jgi:Domain of unknown function (DUF4337)
MRHRLYGRESPLASIEAAVIAVLAALGTLFAHHASIIALAAANQAVLAQGRATSGYTAYEATQVRYNVFQALLATGIVREASARANLQSVAEGEKSASPPLLKKAQALEDQVARDEERSDVILRAYETLQLATTLFEVSIILVSLSALGTARIFLPIGTTLSAIGLVLLIIGFFQGTSVRL